MALPNLYNKDVVDVIVNRINNLTANSVPQWGKMNVAQMLAHNNVTYEISNDDAHPKPNFLMRFLLKSLLKNKIVNEVPYKQNERTAPVFMVSNNQDFNKQKDRLINYLYQTQELGNAHFEGKENPSFGKLTATEWNNMFYKHLNHHLTQFGV
jgi:hypothetical protein